MRLTFVLVVLLGATSSLFVPVATAAPGPVASNCLAGVTPVVSSTSSGNVVTWVDNCTDEVNYFILIRTNGGPINIPDVGGQLPANTTSYTDTDVACGSTYTYAVRAVTAGRPPAAISTSATSAVVVGSRNCAAPPSPPRIGYCATAPVLRVDGTMGIFVNLEFGQPASDPMYRSAVPARYYEGLGISCDVLPGYKDAGYGVDVLKMRDNSGALYEYFTH